MESSVKTRPCEARTAAPFPLSHPGAGVVPLSFWDLDSQNWCSFWWPFQAAKTKDAEPQKKTRPSVSGFEALVDVPHTKKMKLSHSWACFLTRKGTQKRAGQEQAASQSALFFFHIARAIRKGLGSSDSIGSFAFNPSSFPRARADSLQVGWFPMYPRDRTGSNPKPPPKHQLAAAQIHGGQNGSLVMEPKTF